MRYRVFKSFTVSVVVILALSFIACDNSNMKDTSVSADKSDTSISPKDTAMPPEPPSAKVAPTDSIAPEVRHADKDSIGAKISMHRSKVKVVDTGRR